MGADGGINWVRVLDKEELERYVSWVLPYVRNQGAYAYKGEFAAPVPDVGVSGDWLEGAYGTDCDASLGDLCDTIRNLTDVVFDWAFMAGSEDIREYSFSELIESIQTDPDPDTEYRSDPWINPWRNIQPIYSAARDMAFDSRYKIIPEHILAMTLRDWALQARKAIDVDSRHCEETWT